VAKYTVKPGENIFDVATLYNTTAEEIARLNNTSDPFSIKKNMTINVPDTQSNVLSEDMVNNVDTGTSINTATPPPVPTYDKTRYEDTDKGGAAAQAYKDALAALSGHGPFYYSNQSQLDDIMNAILNREKFSYNFNEDAFYQMYKDKYHKQGKMAAANVMGQAAALTGGYGNSYASTAGNQAYLGYLQNLNDVIPELYQMAYDKYSQEGQDMYNQYGMLSADYERQSAAHNAELNRLAAIADAARNDYYSGADSYYDAQERSNQALYDEYTMAANQFADANKEEVVSEPKNEEPPKLTLSQWNALYDKVEEVAMNGEAALEFYLNNLVNNNEVNITPDIAADIMNYYFPLGK
jgi:hypothetical protein